eukprot:GEMP01049885.1.p1 GENE.GEMP01049885.1~~GEMP01049885.1.p1  ORF type:complete len:310 (+),score=72.35 GEMP01049885.1:136-1065(+)
MKKYPPHGEWMRRPLEEKPVKNGDDDKQKELKAAAAKRTAVRREVCRSALDVLTDEQKQTLKTSCASEAFASTLDNLLLASKVILSSSPSCSERGAPAPSRNTVAETSEANEKSVALRKEGDEPRDRQKKERAKSSKPAASYRPEDDSTLAESSRENLIRVRTRIKKNFPFLPQITAKTLVRSFRHEISTLRTLGPDAVHDVLVELFPNHPGPHLSATARSKRVKSKEGKKENGSSSAKNDSKPPEIDHVNAKCPETANAENKRREREKKTDIKKPDGTGKTALPDDEELNAKRAKVIDKKKTKTGKRR